MGGDKPQNKDREITDKGGERCAHRVPHGNQNQVECHVQQSTHKGGDHRPRRLPTSEIHRPKESIQRGKDSRGRQKRNIDPRRGVAVREQNVRKEAAGEHERTATDERHGGIDPPDAGIEATGLLRVTFGCDRELPCAIKNTDYINEQRGDLIRRGVETVDLLRHHGGNHVAVGHTRNPPENNGWNKRQTKCQHGTYDRSRNRARSDSAPQTGDEKEEQSGQRISHDDREHKALHAQPQHGEEQNVQAYHQSGVEKSLRRKEFGATDGAQILRHHGVQVGREHVQNDQPHRSMQHGDKADQGREGKERERSQTQNQKSVGKISLFIRRAVGGVAENALADAHTSQRNDEISGVDDEIGGTVFCRGEASSIKAGHEKDQQLGKQFSNRKHGGIGQQTRAAPARSVRERHTLPSSLLVQNLSLIIVPKYPLSVKGYAAISRKIHPDF